MEDINDFMTTGEAAKCTGYTQDYIGRLCREGELEGARIMGEKMWVIPRKSVINYKPGPQGFGAVKARKEAQKAAMLAEINSAIRNARGLSTSGQPEDISATADGYGG